MLNSNSIIAKQIKSIELLKNIKDRWLNNERNGNGRSY